MDYFSDVYGRFAAMTDTEELSFINTIIFVLVCNFSFSAIVLLLGIEAPYGRYVVNASNFWGFTVPTLVYWIVQELPNIVALIVCINYGDTNMLGNRANQILLFLFGAHYFNRTFIFPFRIRGGKGSALVPFLMATGFTSVNGYINCRMLTKFVEYPDDYATSPIFIAGVALMLIGAYINYHSDEILRNLRKPGETGYKVPRGGMFEYVSGANFLGEIVEWTGFAIASMSPAAACFAFCTATNIGPRAVQHHRWYRKKFDDYPKARKALIPFVF